MLIRDYYSEVLFVVSWGALIGSSFPVARWLSSSNHILISPRFWFVSVTDHSSHTPLLPLFNTQPDASAQLWCLSKWRNDIANTLRIGKARRCRCYSKRCAREGLNGGSIASSTSTPEAPSVCMRQKPGAGGWEKKRRKARHSKAEEAEQMLKPKKLNEWPQNKERKAQYILRRLPGLIPPWDCSSSPPKILSRVYPLCRAVSTLCRLAENAQPYAKRSRPLAQNSQPPDLPKLPLTPSSLSLPTEVETSPRPMVTRNRRDREQLMLASKPH